MSSRKSLREKLALRRAANSSTSHTNTTTAPATTTPSAAETTEETTAEALNEVASDDPWISMLVQCARLGHIEQLEKLLNSANCPPQGAIDSAFFIASEHGQTDVLAMLAGRVSSIDRISQRGDSAVVVSARFGHIEAVELLLRLGMSLEARDSNGDTPLLAAVEHCRESTVRWLLQHKADVNAADDDHNSVLHVAAFQGLPATVLMVLQAGACTNVLNDEDETPLEIAKNAEIARIILEFCAGSAVQICTPNSCSNSLTRAPDCPVAPSPFQELVPGPVSYVFWSALGVSVDNHLFQQFGVFPFDRLNDTERIVLLTEVAEGISGYRTDLQPDLLRESALYAVFAMMKARAKKEIEACENDHSFDASFSWRKRVLEAYEHVYACNAGDAGLTVECMKRSVWNTVINLIARSMFRECFWDKKRMFLTPIAAERPAIVRSWVLPPGYFSPRLPTAEQLSQSAVQLTFKKLMTMSKNFLSEELMEPSGCFCQDCIAEREVPLTFKLQFLEESADEKRKKKGRRQRAIRGTAPSPEEELSLRLARDDLILHHRQELSNFWASISMEEKWALTEMTTTELSETISQSLHWEVLRAALQSYTKYAWEEDLLEISDDCVTIADDMCESNGMEELLMAMLDAVKHADSHGEKACLDTLPTSVCSGLCGASMSGSESCSDKLHEDEWDRRGRQMLENLCLCEFARKVSAQYLLKKEESRAQRVALELELELLQEEEQQMRAAEKKAKRKKKKKKSRLAVKRTDREEEVAVAVMPDAVVCVQPIVEEEHNERIEDVQSEEVPQIPHVSPDIKNVSSRTDNAVPSDSHFGEGVVEGAEDEIVRAILAVEDLALPSASSRQSESITTAVTKKLQSSGEEDALSTSSAGSRKSTRRANGPKSRRFVPAAAPATAQPDRERLEEGSSSSGSQAPSAATSTSRRPRRVQTAAHKQSEINCGYTHGLLFSCSGNSFRECMALKMFTLPRQHHRAVHSTQPGKCALFIFDQETRCLHGVFEPLRPGGENMNPSACLRTSKSAAASSSRFAFCDDSRHSNPLPEAVFKHIFEDCVSTRSLSSNEIISLLVVWRRQDIRKPNDVTPSKPQHQHPQRHPSQPTKLPPTTPAKVPPSPRTEGGRHANMAYPLQAPKPTTASPSGTSGPILRSTSVPLPPTVPSPIWPSTLTPGSGIWAPASAQQQNTAFWKSANQHPHLQSQPRPNEQIPPQHVRAAPTASWSPSRSLPSSRSPSPSVRMQTASAAGMAGHPSPAFQRMRQYPPPPVLQRPSKQQPSNPQSMSSAFSSSLANLTLFGEWDGIWQTGQSERHARTWSSSRTSTSPANATALPNSTSTWMHPQHQAQQQAQQMALPRQPPIPMHVANAGVWAPDAHWAPPPLPTCPTSRPTTAASRPPSW